ncbi:hypothetical protein [Sphingopyxis sp. SE2]|uniref:hypothetical protein n=1 Tax=Sphingopyxis sp. SE2 TaxID=1586240 RepID=UPI0028C4E1F9|nr:hypothetical protein [Sphingopyxis sp. SE2]
MTTIITIDRARACAFQYSIVSEMMSTRALEYVDPITPRHRCGAKAGHRPGKVTDPQRRREVAPRPADRRELIAP